MIKFRHKGDFSLTKKYLVRAKEFDIRNILDKYGAMGVDALSSATPVDTGVTSGSWSYSYTVQNNRYRLKWTNSSENNGVPIVILLQYGHATGTGGYIEGYDFINPSIKPVLDGISNSIQEEIRRL